MIFMFMQNKYLCFRRISKSLIYERLIDFNNLCIHGVM